jgi:hypothetical protein
MGDGPYGDVGLIRRIGRYHEGNAFESKKNEKVKAVLAFSARYRNRVTLEREFKVLNRAITPYRSAEVFYDNRFNTWNRNRLALCKHNCQKGLSNPVGVAQWHEFPHLTVNSDSYQSSVISINFS